MDLPSRLSLLSSFWGSVVESLELEDNDKVSDDGDLLVSTIPPGNIAALKSLHDGPKMHVGPLVVESEPDSCKRTLPSLRHARHELLQPGPSEGCIRCVTHARASPASKVAVQCSVLRSVSAGGAQLLPPQREGKGEQGTCPTRKKGTMQQLDKPSTWGFPKTGAHFLGPFKGILLQFRGVDGVPLFWDIRKGPQVRQSRGSEEKAAS